MIYIGLIAFTVLIVGYIFTMGRKSGRESLENKVMENTLDDIHTVKIAREHLANKPSLRDKLRNRHKK